MISKVSCPGVSLSVNSGEIAEESARKRKEHPLLFSGPMIRALLAGRKTQTRRLSKQWLKVKAGDYLRVKETSRPQVANPRGDVEVTYAADGARVYFEKDSIAEDWVMPQAARRGNVSSLFLPLFFSRITLEATADARLERLQDISDADCFAEGIQTVVDEGSTDDGTARGAYRSLWDSLHKDQPWKSNPELAVLAFRVVKL